MVYNIMKNDLSLAAFQNDVGSIGWNFINAHWGKHPKGPEWLLDRPHEPQD
jgi:hypothetical protein